MMTKEQFLSAHNSLASASLKATKGMINSFMIEKPALFVDGDYAIEKIRRPFIFWLTSMSDAERKKMNEGKK